MSREILFRAWHKKRKKYYEVLHLHIDEFEGNWATCKGFSVIEQKDIHIQVQHEECIIEQYTGLKDKNGTKIFEGDNVCYYTTYHESESASDMFGVEPQDDFDCGSDVHRRYLGSIKFMASVGFVIYNPQVFECLSEGEYPHELLEEDWGLKKKLSHKTMSCTTDRCEVIGNIHEDN